MAKLFVHYSGTVAEFKNFIAQEGKAEEYKNSIVFIKGGANGEGAAIYAKGNYYADVKGLNDLAALVNDLKIIKGVKVGTDERIAQNHNGIIEFSSSEGSSVAVHATSTGITIGLTAEFKNKVNTAASQAKDAVDRLDVAEPKITSLESRMTTAEGDIEAIETAIDGEGGIKARLNAIEAVNSTQSTNIENNTKAIGQLDEKIATINNTTIGGAVKDAKDYTDGEIDKVEEALATAKTELTGAIATAKSEAITEAGKLADAAEADANTYAEGLVNGAKAELKGTANDASTAETIAGAKKHAEEKASAAEGAAKAHAEAQASAAQSAAEGYADNLNDAMNTRVVAVEGAVATLNGTGEGSVAKALADAKDYTDDAIATVNGVAAGLESRVKANEDAIVIINGEGEGSIKKAAADAVATVVANADEDFDTLKEVADWIASDTSGAAKMQIDIARLDGAVTVEGSVKKQIKDAVDAEAAIARAAEQANAAAAEAAQAAADKAQGEVDALEGVVAGVKATADAAATQAALTEEINRASKAEQDNAAAIKAVADDYLKAADKTALEGQISAKVAQSDYNTKVAALEKADNDNLAAAKKYADDELSKAVENLEGQIEEVNAGVAGINVEDSAVSGEYVASVSQSAGKITVTRAALPVYTLDTGSANGTVAFNGVDVAVKGLGSAAYTEASAYATAAQGAKADAAAPQATTYTKTEVDNLLSTNSTNDKAYAASLLEWEEL